jgi:C4-dicarboxylate transporter, DctQ subunit
MLVLIDRVSDACGRVAAWLFFAIGLLITAEVISRYVFNAPTPWTEDVSQALQIWATYLAAAFVLRNRDLIVIEFFITRMGPGRRRLADTISLVAILVFALFAVVYGCAIVAESVAQNRHASTMLGLPRWITEAAIPVGFALLTLQALVELVRLWARTEAAR